MRSAVPYFRDVGSGPGVVCLHANASSSVQWRALMESLAPTHQVLAPDLYGAGQSPDWHSDRVITLADEAALIEPVLQRARSPIILIGHSYGAARARRIAVQNPGRVRALALYEPTLFSLIEADGPAPNDADGIRNVVNAAALALDAGDADAAAGHFIEDWTEPGRWAAIPEARRLVIATSVRSVRRWGHALMTEPTPLAAFGALRLPILRMTGDRSTAAAHGGASRLIRGIPNITRIDFPGLGHMGPLTDAQLVNAEIMRFLLAAASGAAGRPWTPVVRLP